MHSGLRALIFVFLCYETYVGSNCYLKPNKNIFEIKTLVKKILGWGQTFWKKFGRGVLDANLASIKLDVLKRRNGERKHSI